MAKQRNILNCPRCGNLLLVAPKDCPGCKKIDGLALEFLKLAIKNVEGEKKRGPGNRWGSDQGDEL